jgi:excisionase family DNA binding protein
MVYDEGFEYFFGQIQKIAISSMIRVLKEHPPRILPTDAPAEQFLRPVNAARILGITINTLETWAKQGKIKAYRLPGGQMRFRKNEIEERIKKKNFG